jgi:hypothetical protein
MVVCTCPPVVASRVIICDVGSPAGFVPVKVLSGGAVIGRDVERVVLNGGRPLALGIAHGKVGISVGQQVRVTLGAIGVVGLSGGPSPS